ncbi:MFS transporter [Aldersonia kunmingensis]|uniref:MFS transporter n=1 Tax=Aldersonia kunmingensis TaxID=408066 RepID=UPI000831F130|nr:MFS transporter [Aldersonia kunmingensis]
MAESVTPDERTIDHERLPPEIWVLVSAGFVIALGYGIVAPALPQFALSFGVGAAAASALISTFALMRLLFAPVSGRLVQRLGERPVYLIGLAIVSLSTGACAFVSGYWQLMVFRSLGGIGSTMFTVSSLGLVIRISPPRIRGRVSGLYATSFLLGSVGGPLVGGALAGLGLRAPFAIYAVALLIAAAVVYFALRNSGLVAPAAAHDVKPMTFRDGLAQPAYRAALTSSFANGWALFGVRMAIVPLFVVEVLDRDTAIAGLALTVFALGNALVLFPAGRLSDRFGRRAFVVAGTAISGVATAVVGFSDSLPVFLVLCLIAGLGSGLINPAQQAAVADIIGSQARGGPVLAAFQMATDVGTVVGPICAGLLAQKLSYSAAFGLTGVVLLIATGAWLAVADTLDRAKKDPAA